MIDTRKEEVDPKDEHPELTLKNVFFDVLHGVSYILFDPNAISVYYMSAIFIELIGSKFIIYNVPFTDIDFKTYLQQVRLINDNGILDYSKIRGDSGPIVYPAGHVWLYTILDFVYKSESKSNTLSIVDRKPEDSLIEAGIDSGLLFIQKIFGYLLSATIGIYSMVYLFSNYDINDRTKPLFKKPWIFALLLFSKRIHSIFLLRTFNDCIVTFLLAGMILLLQSSCYFSNKLQEEKVRQKKKSCENIEIFNINKEETDYDKEETEEEIKSKLINNVQLATFEDFQFFETSSLFLGSLLFTLALSIKMNVLLYLPGFLIVNYILNNGCMASVLRHVFLIIFVQVILAWKFLKLDQLYSGGEPAENMTIRINYLKNAFQFNRKFLYEWSVNWKFVPEDVFQSEVFHRCLLYLHVSVLLIFIFTRFNIKKSIGKTLGLIFKSMEKPNESVFEHRMNPFIVFYILLVTNFIGVLFARSLHYQFLSWYYFHLPFLYASAGWNSYFMIAFHIFHEYLWNVFPSSWNSSLALMILLSTLLMCLFVNNPLKRFNIVEEKVTPNEEKKQK